MSSEIKFSPPELLTGEHDLEGFDCGEPELNTWLVKRAMFNQTAGASRTYVLPTEKEIAGYYSLAAGSVHRDEALGRVRRNMPEPIPVIVLGRLAVSRKYQGKGLGRLLLRDAVLRAAQASDVIGVRAMLVHALHERAKTFYESYGFKVSPVDTLTLMITIADAKTAMMET